jgi:hypothetical protein
MDCRLISLAGYCRGAYVHSGEDVLTHGLLIAWIEGRVDLHQRNFWISGPYSSANCESASMTVRTAVAWLVACGVVFGSAASAEEPDDVVQGKRLAVLICANCHIVARDQPFEPILRPPAQSFVSMSKG